MKILIWAFPIVVLMTLVLVFQEDFNQLHRQTMKLKFHTQEAAAAAAQFFDLNDYGQGKLVFNQEEAVRAAEYVLQHNLILDEDFSPRTDSYWQEVVRYEIEFYDESNTNFPYLYEHASTYFTLLLTAPTVIVTVDAGTPQLRLWNDSRGIMRTGAHTWQQR